MINEQALKDRLQIIAKEKDIHFNACWKQLLLERFLARLSLSLHVNKFIFKGGFLLSYMMKIGRETIDLDFLLTQMTAEVQGLQEVFEEIVSTSSEDGFSFSFDNIDLLSQPHMEYPGYRITLNTSFGKMKDKIHVDVGIGDAVNPQNREIKLFEYRGKPFFEESISLLVYPIETIFAEKLETVLSKGSKNTRMKDFHDLLLLTRNSKLIQLETLKAAIVSTFKNRETIFELIKFDEEEIKSLQQLWTAHLTNLGKTAQNLELEKDMFKTIHEINSYLSKMELVT